ncbi:MAG: tetratricopeptide repeat protein [Gammaproteobacteria bacterium]
MTKDQHPQASASKPLDLSLQRFRLDSVLVDPIECCLIVEGEKKQIDNKSMCVLVYLAERSRQGSVVETYDIVDRVWPDGMSGDAPAHRCISVIRKALGEDSKAPTFIKTVPRKGYLLLVDAVPEPSGVAPANLQPEPSRWGRFGRPLILLAAVGALAAVISVRNVSVEPPPTKTGPPYSLAILPLSSAKLNAPLEGLGDSISEELITALGQFDKFEVISRRTAFSLGEQNMEPVKVGKLLSVQYVLDGRITQSGEQLRVVAALAETKGGRQRWTNTFSYNADSVSGAATDIATQVARALEVVLGTQDLAFLEQVETRDPDAYSAFLRARQLLRRSRDEATLREAVDLFSEAIAQDGAFVIARAGICQSYVALYAIQQSSNDFDQAESTCTQLARTNPAMAQAKIALATLYRERGDYADSINALKSVVDAFPKHIEALVELGDTYFDSGEMDAARRVYLRAVALAPNEYDAQAGLGVFYYYNQEYTDARKHFARAAALDPGSATPLNNLAATHIELGDSAAAARVWGKSVQIKETHSALTNLGLSHYYRGEFADAERYQRRALTHAPDDYATLGRLAESIRLSGERTDESVAVYREADLAAVTRITKNPRDALAHAHLANFRVHLGQIDRFATQIATAHRLKTDIDSVYYLEALSWAAMSNIDETLRCLEQAVALSFPKRLIRNDPDLRALSDDPKIAAFLAAL